MGDCPFIDEDVCYDDVRFTDEKQGLKARALLFNFLEQLKFMVDSDLESECQKPCTEIRFAIKKTRHSISQAPWNWLGVIFQESYI